jgi:c-di-GMP-related signal transduction protein
MEVFVAKQPIFTKSKEIYSYELLYRNNNNNGFPNIDGDVATADVIINSFINIGIDELANGKPCFINFTEKLLRSKIPTYFRPNQIVVEILESVAIDLSLLDICKELKAKGYKIALDDFVLQLDNPYTLQIMEYIDIIKVDYRESTVQMRKAIEEIAFKYKIKLLAEKVETLEEFELAVNDGYEYFQGYFFSKPSIISSNDVPDYFQNYLIIINHLSTNEPDLIYITQLIEQDLSLSYKLLKLIHSPAYRPVSRINSIKQAIIRLGFKELKKWLYILAIRGNSSQKSEWSNELYMNSLTRAKMCELIAIHKKNKNEAPSYFLTGMFSLMDAIIGMEMERLLNLMPLQREICEAILGEPNHLRQVLELCISVEKGDWDNVTLRCHDLQIEEKTVLGYHNEAFKWSNSLGKI